MRHRSPSILACLSVFLPLLSPLILPAAPARAAVLRVRADASGTPGGLSWATAFGSVQAAITASAPGDEVWVARGVYPERVTLRAGTRLLGGFAGTETAPERDTPWAHPTVLDATGRDGPVVTIPETAINTTVDGFVLTNGSGLANDIGSDVRGGGLYIRGDHATITRNIIRGNTLRSIGEFSAIASGGGLYARDVAVTIANNIVQDNTAHAQARPPFPIYNFVALSQGGGIALDHVTATVANNRIVGNRVISIASPIETFAFGSGLHASTTTGLITNNTVVANGLRPEIPDWDRSDATEGSFYLEGAVAGLTIANNTIAFNGGGMEWEGGAQFHHNDVFGNGRDYFGPDETGEAGNISADPLFVDAPNGNYHLLPGSPALDAGDNAAVLGTPDLSGAPRILSARVDMGAYEHDPSRPHVWHVKPDVSGTPDGISWQTAFASIPAALDAARPGDQVWVAQGTYTEAVRMATPDVGLYGGFAGTETTRAARDPNVYVTTIGPSPATRYAKRVAVVAGVTGFLVDGFTLREGYAGVYCEAGASGTISNNVIAQNGLGEAAEAGGIYAGTASSLIITGNVISGNSCGSGAGILALDARLEVARNVISGNQAFIDVGAPVLGGGILCAGGSAVIHDNLFARNRATADLWIPLLYGRPEARGGAIAGWYADLTIVNNTVVNNVAEIWRSGDSRAAEGGAIYIGHGSAALRNNILAGNRADASTLYGTLGSGDVAFSEDAQVTFRTNLLFDNVPATTPVPAGNIAADPLFVDAANGDYRPRPGSPAINAGDDGSIQRSTDLDGMPRFVAPHVDLGAYESQAPRSFTIADVAQALRIASGLSAASGSTTHYNVVTDGNLETIDLRDAMALARKAAGLAPNP